MYIGPFRANAYPMCPPSREVRVFLDPHTGKRRGASGSVCCVAESVEYVDGRLGTL